AHLTVKANDTSRLYGDADVFTATISGFKNSETLATSGVTGSASFSSSDTATSAAGTTWTITPGQGTLTASNYDFTSFPTGTLTINKAHLTVTADNKSRPEGSPNPTLTATLSGFKNGETLATSGVTGSANLSTSATATSAVGSYAITLVDAGTLSATNYDCPSANFVNGTLTVTNAAPTVTITTPSLT